MSRILLAGVAAIGLVGVAAPSLRAQTQTQLDTAFSSSAFSTGGTTGGTTGGSGGTQGATVGADQGISGEQIREAAAGAGTITGDERYYREPTYLTNPDQVRLRFMGADSADARHFRSVIAPTAQTVYTSGNRTTTAGTAAGGNRFSQSLGGTSAGLGGLGGLSLGGGFGGGGLGGGGLNSTFGGTTQGTGQTGTTTTQRVRAQMNVAFTPPRASAPPVQLSSLLAQRLGRLTPNRSTNPVQVETSGRTVVLRGVVPSSHARDLAERLVMLEPGVSAVQNELTVAPTTGGSTGGR